MDAYTLTAGHRRPAGWMRQRWARTMAAVSEPLAVQCDGVELPGDLTVPGGARGLVVFAHGSGSSRHSPRNRAVASRLVDGGFATFLFDLLTPSEDRVRASRFDIDLLAPRLLAAIAMLRAHPPTTGLPVGLFGASTGAAVALIAAADRPQWISAVVSRGGRPDLAGSRLSQVTAPTLLLVGSRDQEVLALNRQAADHLADVEVSVVDGATHLFEEPGALEQVTESAAAWFSSHLR